VHRKDVKSLCPVRSLAIFGSLTDKDSPSSMTAIPERSVGCSMELTGRRQSLSDSKTAR
jgi:hypothetical protein